MSNIEELVQQQSKVVSEQLKTVAGFADTEEDLRIETEKVLEEFKRQARIPHLKGKHERTVGKGRADSVYNYVIIEYKKPGRLGADSDHPENRKAVEQIKEYIGGLEKEENRKIEKFFGVGFDGHHFIFFRYRGGEEDVWTVEVTRETTERFLRALLALAADRKAFQPEYLAGDFGSESEASIAPEGVQTFYKAIMNTADEKAKVLFGQWKLLFAEVGGYDVSSFNEKIQTLANFYGIEGKPDPAALLFSVQTYYALFMKLLAAEIMNYFGNSMFPSYLQKLRQAGTSRQLRDELEKLEIKGGIYHQLGITNFLEGNMFAWYLNAWETTDAEGHTIDIDRVVRNMVNKMDEYDPLTLSVEPAQSRDLLKQLYENLFPRSVRHDLGEYYTPDWLAEWTIQQTGFEGDPDERVLDPACGSGTFLVLAIQKMKEYNERKLKYREEELLDRILNNVIGFDLNPLAVIAARLNYMIAIRDLIRYGSNMEIPVYLCDSVMTPFENTELYTSSGQAAAHGGDPAAYRKLMTTVGDFFLPTDIAETRGNVGRYAEALEHCVENGYNPGEFIEYLKSQEFELKYEELHDDLYRKLIKLNREGRNSIWARIIKNAFAPVFLERVDYVVGNPPWVNWESLPDDYRHDSKVLWARYPLFPHKGMDAILGKGKKDLSMLMTYVAMDKYLKPNGKLGFVITQSVFQTSGAGQGFRKFRLNSESPVKYIAPVHCDDMVDLKPFEATNRTSVIVLERDKKVDYPVPYILWRKKETGSISTYAELSDVLNKTERLDFVAEPVNSKDDSSPWITGKPKALRAVKKAMGRSSYKAHEGVNSGGANAIYWMEIKKKLDGHKVLVSNYLKGAKKKVEKVEVALEADLVYPLLRGRDVNKWSAKASINILFVQNPKERKGIALDNFMNNYPKAYSYLKKFEEIIISRSAYRRYYKPSDPFYSMFNVGEYTMSPWKVVWRDMGNDIQPAVISSNEDGLILPEHHVMFVSLEDPQEAYYLAGVLGSSISRMIITSYTTTTGISTHVLDHVAIPEFDPGNTLHVKLSELSEQCHQLTEQGDKKGLRNTEKELDEACKDLWGLTDEELEETWQSLKELGL